MEIINKKSLAIKNNTGRSMQRYWIVVYNGHIYFTVAIVRDCSLKVGEFMHFMNEGKKWYFYTNDDKDGFAITPVVTKGGININNSALCRLIRRTMGYSETKTKKFKVVKTSLIQDKCPVYELVPI
jgi:hypothetical protein